MVSARASPTAGAAVKVMKGDEGPTTEASLGEGSFLLSEWSSETPGSMVSAPLS